MVKMMQQKQIWCLKDMYTKRTKYFFTTYTTNFNPCNHILYSVQDQMQIISFTLNNPLQIPLKERTPRFMLIIPITCCCLTSLIHSSKLNQTHFLKNGTNDHYCIIYMKEEKKNPKQLDPWCKVFVTIDYHYMHVYKTTEENTAPVSQAMMYIK